MKDISDFEIFLGSHFEVSDLISGEIERIYSDETGAVYFEVNSQNQIWEVKIK